MLLDPQSINWLHQLWQRLTDQRAAKIDNLDALISSRLSTYDAAELFRMIKQKKTKLFIKPGAFTFIVPEGVTQLEVSLCGAGGGAGGVVYASSQAFGSGGGGGGLFDVPINVTPYQTLNGNVGVGGTSVLGTGISAQGTAGGNTTFAMLTANGGSYGSGNNSNTPTAGLGGITTSGYPNYQAVDGKNGIKGLENATYEGGRGGISLLFNGIGNGGSINRLSAINGSDGCVLISWYE